MSIKPITENTLFYGDNLDILRQYIPDESVDLIYLDPPFNSNRAYSVFFKDEKGTESQAQITAFEDTWRWDTVAQETYQYLITDIKTADKVGKMIEALYSFLGTNRMMAYLVMMTARLVELHRVLKPTGSLYLHCDPTASHYLKIILDTIFGMKYFQNEIVWHYYNKLQGNVNHFASNHDTILFYSKGTTFHFSKVCEHREKPLKLSKRVWDSKTQKLGTVRDDKGKPIYYLATERTIDDVWHLPSLAPTSAERLGYPTQKPLALLERIISASSKPGDVILDPFCGCGTAIAAAQKLDRQWIGIDITHLAIALQKYRLEAMYPNIKFKVIGEPIDISAARQLASENRYQFQWWALSLIRAKPLGGQQGSREGKKGSDKGIDGVIAFIDDSTQKAKRVLVQVKSGHASSRDIRDLVGTLQRENAAIGVFITLEEPTRDMKTEAVSAGYYSSPGWHKDYPRIQILTIDELLHGASVQMPQQFGTFKEAQRVQRTEEVEQTRFA